MTPLERAQQISLLAMQNHGDYTGRIQDAIEQAIKDAVTDEREACAKIASFVLPSDYVRSGDIGQILGFNEAQSLISKAIRARRSE